MNIIKKIIALTALTAVSLTATGSEFGEISSYRELIKPADKNATIEINVKGVTNDQGILLLPVYEDSVVTSVKVNKGNLTDTSARLISVHGRDVWAYQFKNANQDVSLTHTVSVKGVYKEKKAKLKYSHPDGIKRVSYEFINTTPTKIAKYSGALTVPEGKELFGVVIPKWSKKKKTFEIYQEQNLKVVEVKKKKLSPGKSVEFRIRTYQPSVVAERTLWGIVLLLSGVMLWRRRAILKDAPYTGK
jgi:hypothetical protein